MKRKIAVIVFVPNQAARIQQFFSLYFSVMMHPELRASIEFLIGCSPEIKAIFDIENCLVVHSREISKEDAYQFAKLEKREYGYINSWSHFAVEEATETISEYVYALRVDVDTFLCPHLLDIEIADSEICTGQGGYIGGQTTIDELLRIAKQNNLQHRGLHNLGSTWFCRSDLMIDIGQKSLSLAQYLLQEEFSDEGTWPNWYAFVTTMYAGELALNDSNYRINPSSKFDADSTLKTPIDQLYSIHAWHVTDYFSKHKFVAGEYDELPLPTSIESAQDYAFFCSRSGKLLADSIQK